MSTNIITDILCIDKIGVIIHYSKLKTVIWLLLFSRWVTLNSGYTILTIATL